MKKISLHWTLHPEKDMGWYERQKSRMTTDEIARELDINYALSMSNKVFHEFNPVKHLVRKEPKLLSGCPIYRIWDFGKCNSTLYMQIDPYGRKRVIHERVLGKIRDSDDESNTVDQAFVAMKDSERFKGYEIIDVCDPQGSYTDDKRGEDTHVTILQDDFDVYPEFDEIIALPTKIRKKRGLTLVKRDLQFAPGGQEAFQIYVSEDGKEGCPTLLKALQGGYCYKTDAMGNVTERIREDHPYEDVVDCLIYGYLQSSSLPKEKESAYEPTQSQDYISPYLGY